MKNGFNTFQKKTTLPILKFWQDNPQNNFLTFWLHKNILITLQYSGDILAIFLKQKFVECSSNILETLLWLLEFAKRSTFVTVKWNTQHKINFSIENFFKKYFPLKFSLNVPWMTGALQYQRKTQQVFPEYCFPPGLSMNNCLFAMKSFI